MRKFFTVILAVRKFFEPIDEMYAENIQTLAAIGADWVRHTLQQESILPKLLLPQGR